MKLDELFVSYKQVNPASFTPREPIMNNDIFLNRERAREAVTPESEPVSEQTTTWRVPGEEVKKSWENPYTNDRNKWKADMTAAYKRAGLNDNAIKNLIAKNALESGWGKSAQGDFNFGNITTGSSWTGRSVHGNDKNAKGQSITQNFRAYDSLDDYVNDELQLLTNLYSFNQNDDIDTFLGKLQGHNSGKYKYSEDEKYAEKVKSVYNG